MSKKSFLLLSLCLALVLGVVALSGCTKADVPAGDKEVSADAPAWAADLIKPGTITIGSDTNYPPFEFSDGSGGFIGFDVDLVTEVTKKLGVDFEFKTYNFDSLVAGLSAGQDFDMVVSAWTINEERAKNVNFSEPYIRNSFGIVVSKDSDLTSYKQLKAGDIISLQTGSSAHEWAKKEIEPNGIVLKTFENTLDCFNALSAGDAIMVIQDLAMASSVVEDEARNAKVVEEVPVEEFFGFGFQKNELGSNMKADFSAAFQEVVDEGKYAEIYKKWFGVEPSFLPDMK